MEKFKTVAVWVLSVLLAVGFIFIGVTMLINSEGKMTEGFEHFGYPDWFRVLIAVLYIAFGLLLLLPRFAWIGSGGLAVIMIGALVSHLRVKEYFPEPIGSVVCFLILALITYLRWPRSVSKTM
jgi:uncharacterized membrane protein YphA (DoxX/SURF4 family)